MRFFFWSLLISLGLSVSAQESLTMMTYNVDGSSAKDIETFQDWMKEQAVDVAAFQGAPFDAESLSKVTKKWKHKYSAVVEMEGKQLILTSRYPLTTQKNELPNTLKVEVEDVQLYVTQLNQDSLQHRVDAAKAIMADMEAALADGKKVALLGHLEGYAPTDKGIYSQLFRQVKVEDRSNRDILRQIAGYSREKNYELLTVFTEGGLEDVTSTNRAEDAKLVENTFPTAKMGDYQPYQLSRVDYVLLSKALSGQATTRVVNDKFTKRYANHYPVIVTIK
jgi:exonuclease III